jgi:hypothetical protein
LRPNRTHKPYRPASAPLSSGGPSRIRPLASRLSQVRIRRRLIAPSAGAQRNRRRLWVVQLWDTFLLQMDDFDRLLEFQLRRKLDGVVAAPAPVRRGRAGSGRMTKGREDAANKPMGVIPIQLRPDTFIFVEHS